MSDLLINQATQHSIDNYINSPAHALLLIGPAGSGKATVATQLAADILEINNLETYPYKLIIRSDDKTIGIEAARRLEQFLKLKVPSDGPVNRVIIIEDAHKLSIEAQNALLKTLEEPPSSTVLILTVNHGQALLPTIRSRAQLIDVKRPVKTDVESYFKARDHNEKSISQAYSISGGLPGLMTAILEASDHPLLEATQQARAWLRATPFERLSLVDSLSKQKDLTLDTTYIMQQMARVSLQTATGRVADKWRTILESSYAAAEALNQNGQTKLVLTNLALAF